MYVFSLASDACKLGGAVCTDKDTIMRKGTYRAKRNPANMRARGKTWSEIMGNRRGGGAIAPVATGYHHMAQHIPSFPRVSRPQISFFPCPKASNPFPISQWQHTVPKNAYRNIYVTQKKNST